MRLAIGLLTLGLILGFAAGASADKSKPWTPPGPMTEANLDCSNAIPIACGESVQGDNTNFPSNVSAYSCVGWSETGPEVVYVLEITEGNCSVVSAALSGMTADLDVFILGACDEAQCLAYGNTTATTTCLEPGTYYIVVDGYYGAVSAYTLTVSCTPCDCPTPSCCPSTYHCWEQDFNLTDGGFTVEPGGGNPCMWGWGPLTNIEVPGVACEGVTVTNVLATNVPGDYPQCCEGAVIGPVYVAPHAWCMELCHYYDTEARFDGGNVKISTDGGATWAILFPNRGYDNTAYTSAGPCIGGQPVFTGHQFNTTWLQDCFDLTQYVGMNVMLRFDFGADSSIFYPGWYIKWIKFGSEVPSATEQTNWGSLKGLYR